MEQTKNNIFYVFTFFIFVMIAMFCMTLVDIRRNIFEQNAKTYIGKNYSEAWNNLKLEKRDKYFLLQNFFIVSFNTTYQSFYAGEDELAYCFYNGSKCVCFLLEEETGLIIDCYTTKPLPKSFDASRFIGMPCEALYEKIGKPASDGKYGINRNHRHIHYLRKSEIFLSDFIYCFDIDDDGIVKKVELLRMFVA